jgi:hypothetical protein
MESSCAGASVHRVALWNQVVQFSFGLCLFPCSTKHSSCLFYQLILLLSQYFKTTLIWIFLFTYDLLCRLFLSVLERLPVDHLKALNHFCSCPILVSLFLRRWPVRCVKTLYIWLNIPALNACVHAISCVLPSSNVLEG